MSKKIYICETMKGSGIKECSGFTETTISSSLISTTTEAQNYFDTYLSVYPSFVKIAPTKRTVCWEGTLLDASASKSARILAWELEIVNNNTSDVYSKDYYTKYFSTYASQIALVFPVTVNYMKGSITNTFTINLTCLGNSLGNKFGDSFIIPITEQFDNIYSSSAPLHSISIEPAKGPSVQSATSTPLDTTTAIQIIKTTTNFRPKLLRMTLSEASTSSTIYSLTVPETLRFGKLFIKHFLLKELVQQAYYIYQGVRNPVDAPAYFGEPSALSYNRSSPIEHSIYELYARRNTYNLPVNDYRGKSPENMYSVTADTISSSFDSSYIKTIKGYKSEGSVAPTLYPFNATWAELEPIAWIDCVLFKFSFDSKYYSLGELILNGITIPTGISTINVEIYLPNLSVLLDNSITTYTLSEFIGGFNPYNTFELNIDFGYQSSNINNLNLEEGLYYNTNKIRRLFTDKLEVSHFVVDEDTTDSTSSQIVSLKGATVTFKTTIDFTNIETGIKYYVNFITPSLNNNAYFAINIPGGKRIFYIGDYGNPVYDYSYSPTPWGNSPSNKTIKLIDGDDINNPAFIRFIEAAAESIVGATYDA